MHIYVDGGGGRRYKKKFAQIWSEDHHKHITQINTRIEKYPGKLPIHASRRIFCRHHTKKTATNNGHKTHKKHKPAPKKSKIHQRRKTKSALDNTEKRKYITHDLIFTDPDGEIYGDWQHDTERNYKTHYTDPIAPYSRPDGRNLQIMPFRVNGQMDYANDFIL